MSWNEYAEPESAEDEQNGVRRAAAFASAKKLCWVHPAETTKGMGEPQTSEARRRR